MSSLAPPLPIRTRASGREVAGLAFAFAAVLFIVSSVVWSFFGADPVDTALPKLVGLSADALMAAGISLLLWRMPGQGLGVKALAACGLSLIAAVVSAGIDRGLQILCTRPEVPPFDPQYFATVMTFTAAELFGWSCLFLALHYSHQTRETERWLAEARLEANAAQMRALQYQVSPHFLFNTLNSVAGLIEESARDEARDMVLRLAAFMRRTLAIDPLSAVPLAEEVALQRDYLAIEQVRFSDRLRVRIAIAPGAERALVPALILQPLVENAIRHGVAGTPGVALVEIGAETGPSGLTLWVENPQPVAAADRGLGIGLRNVADRLAAQFGAAASCTADVKEGRVRVTLRLPLAP